MKFLLDANLPYSAKEVFPSASEISHARDLDLASATDEEIAREAKKREMILVSRDLGFGNPYRFPPNSHYGLVILRLPHRYNAEQIKKSLSKFLSDADALEIAGKITVIEPSRTRRREL